PSSPSSVSSDVASARLVGAEYSNGGGYMSYLRPGNLFVGSRPRRGRSLSDHTSRLVDMSPIPRKRLRAGEANLRFRCTKAVQNSLENERRVGSQPSAIDQENRT